MDTRRSPTHSKPARTFSPSRVPASLFTFFTHFAQSRADPANIFAYDTVYQRYYASADGGLKWASIGSTSFVPPLFSSGYLQPHPSIPATIFGIGPQLTYSTDAGQSWRYLDLPTQHGSYGLTVDPANPVGFVVCTSQDGLLRTTDEGATWQQVSSGTCLNLAGSKTIPQTLFAHTWESALMRSSDGGLTWSDLTLPLTEKVTQISVAPDASVVYVSTDTTLYQSHDGGSTWSSGSVPYSFSPFYGEPGLIVDPADSTKLYGQYASRGADFLMSISADAKTVNFSTQVGLSYFGELPGSPLSVAADSAGNAILAPPGAIPATDGVGSPGTELEFAL